jgi:hypothetical protein
MRLRYPERQRSMAASLNGLGHVGRVELFGFSTVEVPALEEFGLIGRSRQLAATPLCARGDAGPGILARSPVGICLVSAGADAF